MATRSASNIISFPALAASAQGCLFAEGPFRPRTDEERGAALVKAARTLGSTGAKVSKPKIRAAMDEAFGGAETSGA